MLKIPNLLLLINLAGGLLAACKPEDQGPIARPQTPQQAKEAFIKAFR